ncbi:phosphopentomutase [Lactonifactor longoviformis]|uniref:Phosphopentomutase n=1 Tax=Lactonifactor longoviformis DSM 17459 TaxID=1122155 RepID=A0A1M5BDF8_9CLOT|nr:phosphopentomutase [Lactonifactor longoviformis]SHF40367.1 phosphopentomutase [Lactonifactor longoviformis DSM 17459]
MIRRIFLIVLDSLGIGNAEDAADFGDTGANTLRSISGSPFFHIPFLTKLGFPTIDGVHLQRSSHASLGAVGRLGELSKGKDTTIGHWEICGIVSHTALPTYPRGFPNDIIQPFCEMTGHGILCNRPYSGTEVIRDFGRQHLETHKLIVYTSADSVFQIAAHESCVSLDKLYEYCRMARRILVGTNSVGRVVARPFAGNPGHFYRTPHRHDFSLDPPRHTVLDLLKENSLDVIGIGKINDIFAGRGLTAYSYTSGNEEGMSRTSYYLEQNFHGLCFVNLVDFDMLYGHRNNTDGYAKALSEFDNWLARFCQKMRPDDLLMITADHGCDPGFLKSTDHSREQVPLCIYGEKIIPYNLGTRKGFCDIAATIADIFHLEHCLDGHSFWPLIAK